MRAAVLRNGEIIVGDLPEPVPGPGQVLVKTLACGICGSELRARREAHRAMPLMKHVPWRKGMDWTQDIAFGHEFCGEILAYGPACARRFKPGTRVASVPYMLIDGQADHIGFSSEIVGGYAERMLLSEELLIEVPDHLASIHATYAEPLSVGLRAAAQANMRGGEVPLVIGCGPVGLAVVIALKRLRKQLEFGPIIAVDFQARRRELAQMLGADFVVDPALVSPYRIWELHAVEPMVCLTPEQRGKLPPALRRQLRGYRPAVIFECVGEAGVIQKIYEGAAQAARIIFVGVCIETDQVEHVIATNKELELKYVLGFRRPEYETAFALLADGEVDAAPIVTGTVGLGEVARTFETLTAPSDHVKIVIEPWRMG